MPKAGDDDFAYRKTVYSNSASKMENYAPYSESDFKAELIFPPALTLRESLPLCIKGSRTCWYRPINLSQLLQLKVIFYFNYFIIFLE